MRSSSFIITVFTTLIFNGNIASALPVLRPTQNDRSKVDGSKNLDLHQSERSAATAEVAAIQARAPGAVGNMTEKQLEDLITAAVAKATEPTRQAKFNAGMTTLGGSLLIFSGVTWVAHKGFSRATTDVSVARQPSPSQRCTY